MSTLNCNIFSDQMHAEIMKLLERWRHNNYRKLFQKKKIIENNAKVNPTKNKLIN